MKKTLALSLVLPLALSAVLSAGEVAGVKMSDTVTVEGKTLKLNGMGLRTKVMFKVYVAGLYLEKPVPRRGRRDRSRRGQEHRSLDPAQAFGFPGHRRDRRRVREELEGADAGLEGAAGHAEGLYPGRGQGRRDRPDLRARQGHRRLGPRPEKGVIEGKDFADALLSRCGSAPTPCRTT